MYESPETEVWEVELEYRLLLGYEQNDRGIQDEYADL